MATHDETPSQDDQPIPVVTGSGGITLRKPGVQDGDPDGE
jgi:hypothetical protein